jgi:hypothetical protein
LSPKIIWSRESDVTPLLLPMCFPIDISGKQIEAGITLTI